MNELQPTTLRSAPIPAAWFGRRWRATCHFPLLVLLLIAGTPSPSLAQRDPNAKSAPIPIVPVQNLDFSGELLPSHFVPTNPAELYAAASRILVAPEKSDFETTAQYQARIEALAQKVLLRGLKASDDFAFVLRPSSRSISGPLEKQDDFLTMDFVDTKYNADSEQMFVLVPTDTGAIGTDYKWVSAIHRSVSYGAPYVGQNAFGVRRLIRRIKTDTFELDVADYDWLSLYCTDDTEEQVKAGLYGLGKMFSLTVPPEEARVLSDDIEVIMIGRLRAPFTSHSIDGNEPSLENLKDLTRVHHLLHISLDQLIIANSRTGRILKHFSSQKH